jgi:regulator of protease activity HflC (stomatin/prohibitin superfamily)
MYENETDGRVKWIVSGVVLFLFLVVLLIMNPFAMVQSQQVGIITKFGAIDGTIGEGLHLVNPFTTNVVKMDITTQQLAVPASAASKDLQSVSTQVSVNYNLDSSKVVDIYRELKTEYSTRVIEPSVQEAVKGATAKYTAEELITKREEVKGVIYQDLKLRLATRNIIVTEVLITNFDFSPAFNQAVEAKVQAEQDALASKNKLEQTKYEAEQKVVTAKAEAESIRIQAEAVTSQGGADYVKLKAIEKWNGNVPTTMVPNATVPFIDLNQ